jgi:hypothetical protein
MSEGALGKLDAALAAGGCGGGAAPAANAQPAVTPPVANAEVAELREQVTQLTSTVTGLVSSLQANAAQQKASLVGELKANGNCAFDESELQAMSLGQLEKLAASLRPADYSGRGGPRWNAHDEQVPEPPAVLMAKVEAK